MDSVKDKVWEITCDAGQAEEFQSLYNVTFAFRYTPLSVKF